jgi:multiple antibiotic resistance protein
VQDSQSILQLALTYFIIMNPIGNIPAIMALIKDFDFAHQKRIMRREGLFTFLVVFVFQFVGEYFLGLLEIGSPALSLCGGVLLFLCALGMIFPRQQISGEQKQAQEPFFVPIATPLLAGPGTLTFIMVTAANEPSTLKISTALLLACSGVLAILMVGPYLQKLLGKRGLAVLEQVMGMVLLVMATAMMLDGIRNFILTM